MTLSATTTTDLYARALDAEPHLRAAECLVDLLCTLVRPDDRMCAGCVWEQILKPLVVPLVGWGRREGYESEPWLRTSEAFDVVTDRWLARLDEADPANGHGMGRGTDEGTLPCCS